MDSNDPVAQLEELIETVEATHPKDTEEDHPATHETKENEE